MGDSDAAVATNGQPTPSTSPRPETRTTTGDDDKKKKQPGKGGQSRWNTAFLPARIGADAAAAASAAGIIAPLISTIDKAIIENASGKATLGSSILKSIKTLLFRPHTFFLSKPFGLIFCVYGGTYLCANTLDTAQSTLRNTSAASTTHGAAKFFATSSANVSLSLWKDTHFTRLFSTATPRPVPLPTMMLFMARDSLTIFASFNVPPLLAPYVPMHALPEICQKYWQRQSVAQFVAPAAIQFVSTPLHLLGLDVYNRSGARLGERLEQVRTKWLVSSLARIARIVPAFGVGGVLNTRMRRGLMEKLEPQ